MSGEVTESEFRLAVAIVVDMAERWAEGDRFDSENCGECVEIINRYFKQNPEEKE